MKRALELDEESEASLHKRARLEEGAAHLATVFDASRLTPFDIDDTLTLILLTHGGDLMKDIATLARWRLVCKSWYRVLDRPEYPMLVAIPEGDCEVVSWTRSHLHLTQVAERGVTDPRFVHAKWLRYRFPPPFSDQARASIIMEAWATHGALRFFNEIAIANVGYSSSKGRLKCCLLLIFHHRSDMLRRYVALWTQKNGVGPLMGQQQAMIRCAIAASRTSCLDVLMELFPRCTPIHAIRELADCEWYHSTRPRLEAWLYQYCKRTRDAGRKTLPAALRKWYLLPRDAEHIARLEEPPDAQEEGSDGAVASEGSSDVDSEDEGDEGGAHFSDLDSRSGESSDDPM